MAISIGTSVAVATPRAGSVLNGLITMSEVTKRVPITDRATNQNTGASSPIVQIRLTDPAFDGFVVVKSLAAFQDGSRPDPRRLGERHLNEAMMLVNLIAAANEMDIQQAASLSELDENDAVRNLLDLPVIATLVRDDIELDDGTIVSDWDIKPDLERIQASKSEESADQSEEAPNQAPEDQSDDDGVAF